jgi:hypothetical protein
MSAEDDAKNALSHLIWSAHGAMDPEEAEELATELWNAGYRKLDVKTEWGVHSPWGKDPSISQGSAQTMVKNLKFSGYEASVVWRGVTDWQES